MSSKSGLKSAVVFHVQKVNVDWLDPFVSFNLWQADDRTGTHSWDQNLQLAEGDCLRRKRHLHAYADTHPAQLFQSYLQIQTIAPRDFMQKIICSALEFTTSLYLPAQQTASLSKLILHSMKGLHTNNREFTTEVHKINNFWREGVHKNQLPTTITFFFFHFVKKVGRKLKSLLHLQLVFQSCCFFFFFFFFFVFVSVLSSSLFSPFNDTTENIYHKPSTERWRKLELWGNVDTVHAGKEHKPTNYSAMLVVIANTL